MKPARRKAITKSAIQSAAYPTIIKHDAILWAVLRRAVIGVDTVREDLAPESASLILAVSILYHLNPTS